MKLIIKKNLLIFGIIHKESYFYYLQNKHLLIYYLRKVHCLRNENFGVFPKATQVPGKEWQVNQLNRKINLLAQKAVNHSTLGHRTHSTLVSTVGRNEASQYHHRKTKGVKQLGKRPKLKRV